MEDVVKQEEVKEEKDDKGIEYWQQQASQDNANFRKERDTKEGIEREAGETKAQLAKTNQELTDLKSKLDQQSEYQKMDKEVVDPAVAKNIEALQKQVEGLSGKLSQQNAKITQYEQTESQREQDRQYNQAVEQICLPLDEEFGAKFRSEARTMADKAVESGEETKPQTTLEAYMLHKKMYSQLAKKSDKKKTTATDNGKGTKVVQPELKPGTYAEVLAEMKAKCKT